VFFLATEFLFMATILKLKVAKGRFFEKVSLERCPLIVQVSHRVVRPEQTVDKERKKR